MNKLIVIAGPTATGKSDLSVRLAKKIGGEVISADSMQVYRHMDIGTAKITEDEMDGVPHHLIDIVDPSFDFNVFVFQKYAKEAIDKIYKNGHIPIICGGTGFYIQSVAYDIEFTQNDPKDLREKLEKELSKKGKSALYERLCALDPEYAKTLHENNVKKVIRAIEFVESTGMKLSDHNVSERQKASPYDLRYFVLTDKRELLYENINRRVDIMVKDGLVDEVKALRDMGYVKDQTSMQGLGYKEIFDFLEGEISLDEAIELIKLRTRHFAKRQLTWFRREKDVIWVDKSAFSYDKDEILEFVIERSR